MMPSVYHRISGEPYRYVPSLAGQLPPLIDQLDPGSNHIPDEPLKDLLLRGRVQRSSG